MHRLSRSSLANFHLFALAIVAILSYLAVSVRADDDKCAAHEATFSCPTCGGIEVTDCTTCEGYLFSDHRLGICYDRKLFHVKGNEDGDPDNHYPFLWTDLVGTVVWFLTAGIAVSCGVGGGGIYMPLGMILLRFAPKQSTGLSQACIFGAGLGGLILNSRKRHPDRHIRDTKGVPKGDGSGKILPYELDKVPAEIEEDRRLYLEGGDGKRQFYTRPIIDYDLALFQAPMELAGAVVGVTIQRLLPDWLFLSIAVFVLSLTCFKTYQKFFESYKKDKMQKKHLEFLAQRHLDEQEAQKIPGSPPPGYNSDESDHTTVELCADSAPDDAICEENKESEHDPEMSLEVVVPQDITSSLDENDDPKELELRRQFLAKDSDQFPKVKIASLFALWAGLTVIIFLKGGKGVASIIGITCEDSGFYILIAFQFLWTLGFAFVFGRQAIKRTKARLAVNYPYHEHDILWDFKQVRDFSMVSFGAGIIGGLVGISAGYFTGPFMIQRGLHPRVSTATTATTMLLTSSSVAVMFVLSGLLPWEYALYFFLVCVSGAFIGKTRIDAYVKKTGMASVLIGALATIIGCSTLGCLVILLTNLASSDWCLSGFHDFCPAVVDLEAECSMRFLAVKEMFPY